MEAMILAAGAGTRLCIIHRIQQLLQGGTLIKHGVVADLDICI